MNDKKILRYIDKELPKTKFVTANVRKLGNETYKEVKHLPKKEVLLLCEELLKKSMPHKTIAFAWCFKLKKSYTTSDFKVFEKWIKKYIQDWSDCDDFCTHAVGEILIQYPELVKNLASWATSSKWQVRRASAVSLIYPVRKGFYIKETKKISKILMQDEEDLVLKGYGWLLKESCKQFQNEVYKFVKLHRKKMPRLSLRYSVEKMPENLRKEILS